MGELLKRIRSQMGHSSARSFYLFLSSRASLDFNYSYYMKIEAEQVLPSHKIIQQIAALLPTGYGDELVREYCLKLFPNRGHLFRNENREPLPMAPREPQSPTPSQPPFHQLELTERQVAGLARSPQHYFLFLLVTLARFPLDRDRVAERYAFGEIETLMKDLASAKLVNRDTAGKLVPCYPEYRFPKPETESLRKHYAKIDEYDRLKTEFFGLAKIRRGQFFRRISPRYLQLLQQNLELTFQVIRLADETDPAYNTEAVSFTLALHAGPLLD